MTLSSAQLKQLAEVFAADMEAGLQQQKSTLLMIPSHVDVIPDGYALNKGRLWQCWILSSSKRLQAGKGGVLWYRVWRLKAQSDVHKAFGHYS